MTKVCHFLPVTSYHGILPPIPSHNLSGHASARSTAIMIRRDGTLIIFLWGELQRRTTLCWMAIITSISEYKANDSHRPGAASAKLQHKVVVVTGSGHSHLPDNFPACFTWCRTSSPSIATIRQSTCTI